MGHRSSKFLVDIHFEDGASEEECRQIFDHFANKQGILDQVQSRKFLEKLYKYKTQKTVTRDEFVSLMMDEIDRDGDGTLSWEELQAYRGSGLESKKHDWSLLQGYSLEAASALWDEFSCEGERTSRSRLSSFLTKATSFRTSPSNSVSGSAPKKNSLKSPTSSPPLSSRTLAPKKSSLKQTVADSTTSKKPVLNIVTDASSPTTTTKLASPKLNSSPSSPQHSPATSPSARLAISAEPPPIALSEAAPALHYSNSMTIYESICNFVAHLLRHEQRYGRTLDDAQDLVKSLVMRGVQIDLGSFRATTGPAFEVIQEWRQNDRIRQRNLKAANTELLKLVKKAAAVCDRSLRYAIDEELRSELTFLPHVLQTEVLHYLPIHDEKRSLLMRQNIVQQLYLVVWRTEEPGLTMDLYKSYSALLEKCVKICKGIPIPKYCLREEEGDSNVFLPPSSLDEHEMQKSQSSLLAVLSTLQQDLMETLGVQSMEQVAKQLPPLGVACFQCGTQPVTTHCVFHVPECKCQRRVTTGCMLNFHNTRSLTLLARTVFGLGTKTLLCAASGGQIDVQQGGDRPFLQHTWVRDMAGAERNQNYLQNKKLQLEYQDIEVAIQKCLKDPLRPFRM